MQLNMHVYRLFYVKLQRYIIDCRAYLSYDNGKPRSVFSLPMATGIKTHSGGNKGPVYWREDTEHMVSVLCPPPLPFTKVIVLFKEDSRN